MVSPSQHQLCLNILYSYKEYRLMAKYCVCTALILVSIVHNLTFSYQNELSWVEFQPHRLKLRAYRNQVQAYDTLHHTLKVTPCTPTTSLIKTMGLEHISKPPRKSSFASKWDNLMVTKGVCITSHLLLMYIIWKVIIETHKICNLYFYVFVFHTLLPWLKWYVNKQGLRFNAVQYCVPG